MNNWKVIFATVVIFGAGVITGGLLVNYVEHSHPRALRKFAAASAGRASATNQVLRTSDPAKPHLPDVLNRQFLQQLDEALHLKPEQREVIQKIISDRQAQMRRGILDARLEIREALTPEQQEQFDILVKRPAHRPSLLNTNGPAVIPPATNAPAL